MSRRSSIQQAARFALVAISLVLAGVAISYWSDETFTSYAQADGRVTHTVSGNTETWRIDEPNVKQRVTPYSQIRFQPGDHVTIQASGCVQTGGSGNTWKRYVNPSGPDADRLYHGLIWIPGVIGGPAATGVPADPKRIVAYIGPNQSFSVPSGVDARQLYLRLGYEDDGYGDNGYYSHDDGTQDQCKGVGNASVVITIAHNPPGPGGTPPPAPVAPFDLVWDSEDDNGIPLNAKWGWQITHPGARPDPTQCTNGPFKSPCTNWFDVVSQDTAEICNLEQYEPGKTNSPPLYGVAGHVNWAAGTYVGRIKWETHSTPGTDDDYNFDLYPVNDAGLVSVRDNLEVEFDSDQTIDHFNSPWWNAFHKAVDNYRSDDEINQLWFKEPDGTIGRYGIVTGLVGLEMCHSGSNELHPAWAFAVRVKDDNPNDEVWAMFIRRAGNEGFCSGDQHYLTDLPGDNYTFRLPWRPGASSVSSTSSTTFLQTSSGGSGPGISWASNQGVLVSFTLPAPQQPLGNNIIYGELHLQWPGGQGPAPIPTTTTTRTGVGTATGLRLPAGGAQVRAIPSGQPPPRAGQPPLRGVPAAGQPVQAARGEEPEKRVASALTKMSAVLRNQMLALAPRPPGAVQAQALRQGTITQIQSLPQKPARARRRQFQSVADPAKRQRNQQALDALRRSIVK
jgi:hypothetical protein